MGKCWWRWTKQENWKSYYNISRFNIIHRIGIFFFWPWLATVVVHCEVSASELVDMSEATCTISFSRLCSTSWSCVSVDLWAVCLLCRVTAAAAVGYGCVVSVMGVVLCSACGAGGPRKESKMLSMTWSAPSATKMDSRSVQSVAEQTVPQLTHSQVNSISHHYIHKESTLKRDGTLVHWEKKWLNLKTKKMFVIQWILLVCMLCIPYL